MKRKKRKRYIGNPYADSVVVVFGNCLVDYAGARVDLECDPNNEHAKIVQEYCEDFISWLQDVTGFSKNDLIIMINRIMEDKDGQEQLQG